MLASLENTARRLNSEVECDCATSIYWLIQRAHSLIV
jgi:hypothetical protein